MMSITISEHFVPADMEYDENGQRPAGYRALNIEGKGKTIATVSGPIEVVKESRYSMVRLDGGTYALRDVLSFARKGERGLSIVG